MSRLPLIGVSLDIEKSPSYADEPWYALRENYCSAISHAGGVPFALPHEHERVSDYLDCLDGLVISGGMFDIPPNLYGEQEYQGELVTKEQRTVFEIALIKGAIERDLPLIGICGGMQLLAVVKGAKLIQHIPNEVKDSLVHMQAQPHHLAGHQVELVKDSQLHQITRQDLMQVNSVHHQAIKDVPSGIRVSARAADGVIEAIELPEQSFCFGLQWHPEYRINAGEEKLFRALVRAASRHAWV